MSEYRVTAPCVYAQDGRAVMHLHGGAFVELEDDVAATVADCVQLIDRTGGVEETAEASLEQHPVAAEEPEVIDPDGAEAVTAQDSVAEAERPARRRRGESDG